MARKDRRGRDERGKDVTGRGDRVTDGARGAPDRGESQGDPLESASDVRANAEQGASPDATSGARHSDFADRDTPSGASRGTATGASSAGGDDSRANGPPREEQSADYLEQLQRLKAEFDNYRKRVTREREEWHQSVQADTVRRFLSVTDDLRRAREHFRLDQPPDAEGLLMILKRFEDILAQLGLEEQDTEPGTEFNPEEHEAVFASPSAMIPEGRIVQTIEPGYLFHGRLLRPSKVCVSSGPVPE